MRKTRLYLLFSFLFLLIPTISFGYIGLIEEINPNIPHKRAVALNDHIIDLSNQYRIPVDLIVAMIWQESHFRNMRSQVRTRQGQEVSCGYIQIQPETFELEAGYPLVGETKEKQCQSMIYSWKTTLRVAVKHLNTLRDQYGLLNAIGSYNSGPRYGSKNIEYASKVLSKYREIKR